MLTWLFVATRIIANPVSNVFQKRLAHRSANPLFIIAVTHALLTLACVPLLFGPFELNAGFPFWANIVVAGFLAVAGNALLVAALKRSDLSVLGPINAYKSVVSLVLGIFLVHEIPTPMGVVGVLLILAGSYFVIDRDENEPHRNAFVRFFQERGVQLRFAALGLSATEAVFLKRALLASSPLTTFVIWCIVGLPIAALASAVLLRGEWREEAVIFRENRVTYLRLAVATGLMQFATLLTFGKLQVGYSLALFQLSTLLSVFLGYRYFQERNIQKRLLGSMIMVGGAVLIVAFGGSGRQMSSRPSQAPSPERANRESDRSLPVRSTRLRSKRGDRPCGRTDLWTTSAPYENLYAVRLASLMPRGEFCSKPEFAGVTSTERRRVLLCGQ